MVVAVSDDALSKTAPGMTRAIINTAQAITGEFLRNPDRAFPAGAMEQAVVDAIGADAATFIDASRLASRLMGHSIATNIFMLGYAFQLGLIPLSSAALLRAIELNGSTVDENRRAFSWGRRAALDPGRRRGHGGRRRTGGARPQAIVGFRRTGPAPPRLPGVLPGCRLCTALYRPGRTGSRQGRHQRARH
jgi:hypothetical protein